MVNRKSDVYTNKELAQKVEEEGLESTVRWGVDPDFIEDEELRELWVQAQTALSGIEERLEDEDA